MMNALKLQTTNNQTSLLLCLISFLFLLRCLPSGAFFFPLKNILAGIGCSLRGILFSFRFLPGFSLSLLLLARFQLVQVLFERLLHREGSIAEHLDDLWQVDALLRQKFLSKPKLIWSQSLTLTRLLDLFYLQVTLWSAHNTRQRSRVLPNQFRNLSRLKWPSGTQPPAAN